MKIILILGVMMTIFHICVFLYGITAGRDKSNGR